MQLLNTLYVTLPDAFLRLDNDTLRVEVERESRLQVPLHHLTSVVCLGNVGFTTPLAHRLAEAGIALVLLDANGRFKARLEGPVAGNILLRQAQHAKAADPAFALDTARACVAGKIKNARQVLLRGARESKQAVEAAQLARGADDLAAALRGLPQAATLDEVRGVEGDAARRYFE
ncbi:MAG: CRISPR-associated endonuclease Cas1, partial [bacterium]